MRKYCIDYIFWNKCNFVNEMFDMYHYLDKLLHLGKHLPVFDTDFNFFFHRNSKQYFLKIEFQNMEEAAFDITE